MIVVTNQRPDPVIEQPVKAHVPEAELMVRAPQLRLPVGAQRERRVTATDRVLPEVRQRQRRRLQRAAEVNRNTVGATAHRGGC